MKSAKFLFASPVGAIGAVLLMTCAANAAVYLRADAPGGTDGQTFDGTSWSTAYTTVDQAYEDLLSKPETIADRTLYVAKGIYPTAAAQASPGNTFAAIAIYGGYKGEVDGDMTRDIHEYQTIFSGISNPTASKWTRYKPKLGEYGESSSATSFYVVMDGKVFMPAFTSDYDVLLPGTVGNTQNVRALTVSAGGEGAVVNGVNFVCYGRGDPCCINILSGAGSVTIEDCIFAGNQPQVGAVRFQSSASSLVRNCTFFGGNLYATSASPLVAPANVFVMGCSFSGFRKSDGYAMAPMVSGDASVSNCVFTHNYVANATSGNGAGPLIGSGSGTWSDCIITNNFAADHSDSWKIGASILGLSGRLERSLVANNRVEVKPVDGYTYFLVGKTGSNGAATYDDCLFASNVVVAISTTAMAGGSYGLGILGGRPMWATSGYCQNTLRNCTFDGNVVVPCEAEGVATTLARAMLVSDYTGGTGCDSFVDVKNCTFLGSFAAGVADIAQAGISKKTSTIADSIITLTDADADELPFNLTDRAMFTVKNCSIRNMIPQFYPERPTITDGLCYDPIPFERIPFTVLGTDTGWTLPRPAAKVPGIRETTDGSVRGAVNALSETAENGRTLVIRREPFTGGTVDIPSQAVAAGAAIAPVTAFPAAGSSLLGWFAEGEEEPVSPDNPLELASLDDDLVILTARFGMPKVTITFDLGEAGVFGDGNAVTNLICTVGDEFPDWPAYTAVETRHIYARDEMPAVVPSADTTYRAYSVTKELRKVYVNEGEDLAAAYADAGRYRGELYVGPGTYPVVAPMALLPNVTVYGAEGVVISGANDGSYTYNAFVSDAANVTNVAFYGLAFKDFSHDAISLTGTGGDRVVVSNCVFDTCNRSKTLTSANYGALSVWYRPLDCVDCRFTNNCRAIVHRFTAATTNLFANCTFVGNKDGCIAQFSEAGGRTLVTNCVFDANTGTTYDAGSSTWPVGPCLLYRNVGSHRLDVEDCVVANTRMSDEVYPPLYFDGESSANICVARCSFTNNVYSGGGGRADHAGVAFVNSKSKVVTFRDCYFGYNCVTASAMAAVSGIVLNGNLAIYLNVLNCTFEHNVAKTTASGKTAGMIENNSYSAIGLAHCTFADNVAEAPAIAADIMNANGWNSDVRAVNCVFWSADSDYVPFARFSGATTDSPAQFANCVVKNFDASIFGNLTLFGDGVWTDDPRLREKAEKGENGVLARRLAGDSRFVKSAFGDVWLHNNKLYAYSKELTGSASKPWQALCDKPAPAASVSGLTRSSPRTKDAWGAQRRAKGAAVGPVNVKLGMLLLVR